MKYDIFISCKSEDYYLGETIYNDLRTASLNPFIASKELKRLGVADYGKSIETALDSSRHLVIVTSNANYLREESSPYVYFEWHSFLEEKKSGRKVGGNIITVLTDGVRINDLPYALRGYQSIIYKERHLLVDYVKTYMSTIGRDSRTTNNPISISPSATDAIWTQTRSMFPKNKTRNWAKPKKSFYERFKEKANDYLWEKEIPIIGIPLGLVLMILLFVGIFGWCINKCDDDSNYTRIGYYCGDGFILTDTIRTKENLDLDIKAAEKGNTEAQLRVGCAYYKGYDVVDGKPDMDKAVYWLRKAAENGYTYAQMNMGAILADQSKEEAKAWYLKADSAGNIRAAYYIGNLYFKDADYEQALDWYKKASESGVSDASYNIGYMYYTGLDVDKDYAVAMEWFKKSSEQGDKWMADFAIGTMYENGYGVEEDIQEAIKWYTKSKDTDEDCRKALERLE